MHTELVKRRRYSAVFIKQLRQAKWSAPVILSDLVTTDVLAGLGSAGDGIYLVQLSDLAAPLTQHLREL